MIDYDKLKQAHELADKYAAESSNTVVIYSYRDINEFNLSLYVNGIEVFAKPSLDKLIDMLKKFTTPDPKYNIGQELWWVNGVTERWTPDIVSGRITHRKFIDGFWVYGRGMYEIGENCLYTSRDELIEGHIAYWESLRRQC
jgi:hypothetical protein